ncbi:MAG: glycosyltransferase, partial [Planctomycetota bacterium]
IWVYGSKDVFDLGKLYNLSETTNQRIDYLGYLKRISLSKLHTDFIDSLPLRRNSQKKIVCVAGGGEDGNPLGETFLQTLSNFPNKYVGTLVTGPHLDRVDARNLIDRFHQFNNLEIMRFTTHLEDHLRAADVIVSMGGYNATLEAIAVRKPTIIIPRVSPRKEQWIRAKKFSQKGLINMIHPDELTTEKLLEAIETGLESPHLKTVEELGLNMDGIGNFLSRVDEILSTTIRKRKEEDDVNDTLLRA